MSFRAFVMGIAAAPLLGALSFATGCSGASAEGKPVAAVGGAVKLQVTERGFEPHNVKVKRGEPVKLLVTRKTDQTCARELVLDEYGINVKLPLDTEVAIAFTPTKSGELTYGCSMDKMISGVITVE